MTERDRIRRERFAYEREAKKTDPYFRLSQLVGVDVVPVKPERERLWAR